MCWEQGELSLPSAASPAPMCLAWGIQELGVNGAGGTLPRCAKVGRRARHQCWWQEARWGCQRRTKGPFFTLSLAGHVTLNKQTTE